MKGWGWTSVSSPPLRQVCYGGRALPQSCGLAVRRWARELLQMSQNTFLFSIYVAFYSSPDDGLRKNGDIGTFAKAGMAVRRWTKLYFCLVQLTKFPAGKRNVDFRSKRKHMFWQCKSLYWIRDVSELNAIQIINVKAQLRSSDQLSQYNSWFKDSAQSFAVVREGGYFALEYGGNKFALLNKGFCRHLHALISRRQVRIQSYVSNKDWATIVHCWRKQISTIFPVEINIYGTRADAEEVGSILSKSGIFLQLPRYGPYIAQYYNPQLLRIEGYSEQISAATLFSVAEDVGDTPDRRVEEEPQANDSVDFILDSLSHHVNLREIPVDHRIKSTLLP